MIDCRVNNLKSTFEMFLIVYPNYLLKVFYLFYFTSIFSFFISEYMFCYSESNLRIFSTDVGVHTFRWNFLSTKEIFEGDTGWNKMVDEFVNFSI